ncbi:MAG: hypothetical protein HC827_19105 [Cyanobacteria bacterium RM1_2_2]|nr:hypothetical protein [Cyanobacteria bacterium RM1_2_2]
METDSQNIDPLLEKLWAKKYVGNLANYAWETSAPSATGREQIAEKMLGTLRFASSQAWGKTEALLISELQRHRIHADLIDPWRIASDSRLLFEKAVESYTHQLRPERFSVVIAPECGRIRQAYSAQDPRVLGFMSMQFHYTGQLLLEKLTADEKPLIADYFKVMDDHLYMPLHRAYEAAAAHVAGSPALLAVQHLLPISTQIAEFICAEVAEHNPDHRCYSGSLQDATVRISSIRDVEMFQIYLCLCVLEGNVAAVQQELFPLCVMLYPPLNVKWELVRQLLGLLGWEIQKRLPPADHKTFAPYGKALQEMFSLDVFPESNPIWSNHPDTVRFMNMARDLLQDFLQAPS